MIRNETDFRIICGGCTLFLCLGLMWLLEACLADPSFRPLCSDWQSLQIIPYSLAWLASDTPRGVNLPVFWLAFGLHWFLVGSMVVSRVIEYLFHLSDLIRNQSVDQASYRMFDI